MKQFLLNQTMDDADEGRLGGLVFHWYCIVNSRPKSHSDSQPAPSLPLSSFLLFLTSCTLLSLSLFLSLRSYPFVYRIAKLFTRGASRNFGRPRLSLDILHLFANHLSRVRVLRYRPSYRSIMQRLRNLYLFIYTSLPRLARSNRFFLFSSRWYCFFFFSFFCVT